MDTEYITVGKYKGEWDFSVGSIVRDLSYEEMSELRQMIIVGIGTMEHMWRDSRNNPTYQNTEK